MLDQRSVNRKEFNFLSADFSIGFLFSFANAISRMLPLFMVLSWILTVSLNVKDIVQEKEKRLKEIMRIMGLKDSVHWFTWFVLCATVMMLTAFILVLLLKVRKSGKT